MSLHAVTFWKVVCDACGEDAFVGDEFAAYADPTDALEAVEDRRDWSERIGADGKPRHRCPKHEPFKEGR